MIFSIVLDLNLIIVIFMKFNINTTGVTCGAGTDDISTPSIGFNRIRVVQCFLFCVVWVIVGLFGLFSFGHCIVCPLVSSNGSFQMQPKLRALAIKLFILVIRVCAVMKTDELNEYVDI